MVLCGIVTVVLFVGIWILRKHPAWEKLKNPYRILLLFSLFGIFLGVMEQKESNTLENGKIYRNPYGEGIREADLEVVVPEEDTEYAITLEIEEKELTLQEEQEKIKKAMKEIDESFCGSNASLENIQDNPVVAESYQDEMVTAEWDFSEECISRMGEIDTFALGEEKRLVEANVRLTCGESEGNYQFYFWLVPKEKNAKERVTADIYRQIAEQAITAEEVLLPEMADGKTIYWEEPKGHKPMEMLCIGILAAIALAYAAREQDLKKLQKRKEKLLLEYPEFVSKLSLLLGAGMNISTAFRKINQMQERQSVKKDGMVYKELRQMIYEIDNGMGEMRACREFAERCDLQPYRKLVSLLQSGQKMGNRELIERLHEEADRVFAERKNTARKLGEEAGTKMLAPMMMMLVIVMGIVIFPAFLSIYNM